MQTDELEVLLNRALRGIDLSGLKLRKRSKVVKERICVALGYPVPNTFRRTKPRFPGQNFDTYVQKSNNLQIWNEEISLARRYVLIHVSEVNVVDSVRVVTGRVLARLDTTGTLTQKYQARLVKGNHRTELIAARDTDNLSLVVGLRDRPVTFYQGPNDDPIGEFLFPIRVLYDQLCNLVGRKLPDSGIDQERNRGAELHRMICDFLGYRRYDDTGQFPDIRNQLLEIKLQTSVTIDLGLVLPDSTEFLDIPPIMGRRIRHCDVRYAIFAGVTDGEHVELSNLYVTTGEAFFTRFPQFQGNRINRKLQIPLPTDFFGR